MRPSFGHALAAFGVLAFAVPAGALEVNPHNTAPCTTHCHRESPRFGIDTRKTVTFRSSIDDPGQCAPCHGADETLHPVLRVAGEGPPGGRRSSYLPAGSSFAFDGKVVCISCHFIHASDGRYGLLRGFPGTWDPRYFGSWQEFCRECHGVNLSQRSPHTGEAGSCAFCHPAKPKSGKSTEVVHRGSDLCTLCHGGAEKHPAAVNPFESRQPCSGCHDPHAKAAARPGLLNERYLDAAKESEVIRPHFRKALCFACHENLDDYALRNDDLNVLCNRCHESGKIAGNIHPLRRVPPTITVPKGWPLAEGALTCLTCHEQGHEDQEPLPKMLRGGPYAGARDVCRGCHTGDDLQASTIHRDINEGRRCEFCHKHRPVVGRDKAGTVDFIADPDILCYRCHDVTGENPTVHHQLLASREIDPDKLPEGFPRYKGRVICASCHNPHLLSAVGYRLREWIGAGEFCVSCHRS